LQSLTKCLKQQAPSTSRGLLVDHFARAPPFLTDLWLGIARWRQLRQPRGQAAQIKLCLRFLDEGSWDPSHERDCVAPRSMFLRRYMDVGTVFQSHAARRPTQNGRSSRATASPMWPGADADLPFSSPERRRGRFRFHYTIEEHLSHAELSSECWPESLDLVMRTNATNAVALVPRSTGLRRSCRACQFDRSVNPLYKR
jgi:hypothetical protein